MDESAILITGANGQLGTALKLKYPGAQQADVSELDITNAESVAHYDWNGVTHILNAAAYTNVDGAETLEGRIATWQINSVGAGNLARAAVEHDLTIFHLSTDYVFDGTQSPHLETEAFSPLGVYAQSKAAGDIAVAIAPKHYIIRTSAVVGEGKNFVRTMLGLGQKGIAPTVVADQIGRLTFTSELVKAIDHLLTNQLAYGTYNVTNSGDSVSWADITREIFKLSGYDLAVTDTTTEEYFASKTGISPRPLQSTLSLDKLAATGFVFTDWHDGLKAYIAKEQA
jgi:dTDP-4-dehydrorhamnose reductase